MEYSASAIWLAVNSEYGDRLTEITREHVALAKELILNRGSLRPANGKYTRPESPSCARHETKLYEKFEGELPMKPTILEQLAEQILLSKQVQERAQRELRAAEEEMLRIREKIQAVRFDPDNLDEAVRKLEQKIEAELNKLAA
jgi:chromosome segregation ATPase